MSEGFHIIRSLITKTDGTLFLKPLNQSQDYNIARRPKVKAILLMASHLGAIGLMKKGRFVCDAQGWLPQNYKKDKCVNILGVSIFAQVCSTSILMKSRK